MATPVRKTSPFLDDMVTAFNNTKAFAMAQLRLMQADLAACAADGDVSVSTTFVALGSHNDCSEYVIVSDDAEDLPTSLTLLKEMALSYTRHCADTLAHAVADDTNALTEDPATDLATALLLAEDLRDQYEAHRIDTSSHYEADSTNDVTADPATDLDTLVDLLNDLKDQLNGHFGSGPSAKSLRLIDA